MIKNKMIIPPIKCQGIKTKLVPWIKNKLPKDFNIWYEPFMGSGVVGFNILPQKAVFCDTNPHIIKFYNDIKEGYISSEKVRLFLSKEGDKLLRYSDTYYKEVRERFNDKPDSYDFLFLNRCCFNGMMRFNSKGGFNVPFCKKNNRFSKSYITKIANQVSNIEKILALYDYKFISKPFNEIIINSKKEDLIYCDPPYIDRYSDYFNLWQEKDENLLYDILSKTTSKFILSTWHHNKFRKNSYIDNLWGNYLVETKEHFYHVGAKEENRHSMIEALVTNF